MIWVSNDCKLKLSLKVGMHMHLSDVIDYKCLLACRFQVR